MFGRYRIEAMVSRGAMGIVVRAMDMQLSRPVALKLLPLESTAALAEGAGFLEEARLAASLDHPAIVPVYEAGVIDGTPFIAMRLVPGTDLAHLLRAEAPLTLAATLRIVAPIADALDAAHAHGLVHGDVKPGNVLVESAAEGRVYLADFGLTWRMDTVSGVAGRPGTLDYMAPELLSGGPIDGRADQYALGCVVAHCLLGHAPFERGTEALIVEAHLTAEPPSVEAHIPGGCPGLDAHLARAMAKQAGDRFPDCAGFIAALRSATGALDATTTQTAPVSMAGPPSVPAPPSTAAPPSTRAHDPALAVPAVAAAPAMLRSDPRRDLAVLRGRRTGVALLLATFALALAVGSVGLLQGTGGPSPPLLPSGVTAEQRAWERAWVTRAEQAAIDAGWQHCPENQIHGRDRDCPMRSLDCLPQRDGPQFTAGGAYAGIMCRFSTDQVVLNGFLFDFPDPDARDARYATDVLYIGDVRDRAEACAGDRPGEGAWVSGSSTGRFACWLRAPASGGVPHWWLGWYQDGSTRLGLLVSQPIDGTAALMDAWRELPRPLGIGSEITAGGPSPSADSIPSEGVAPSERLAGT